MKLITIKEAAGILGLPANRLYQLDAILKPVYEMRGSRMRTRFYDSEHVLKMKPEIDKLDIRVEPVRYKEDGEPKRKYRKRYLTEKENWDGAVSYLYNILYHSAAIKIRAVTIKRAHFEKLLVKNCTYCGKPPELRKVGRYEVFVNGIDRVDSSKGYINGNCVPCCKRCNRMKSDMSTDTFLECVKSIYDYNAVKTDE